ncbi:unnamed protein product [Amoebophrya sp. A25]|nr:unnamed protein product [Amoebophrya sp. A25]|eukprot:GSA25T00022907001.1
MLGMLSVLVVCCIVLYTLSKEEKKKGAKKEVEMTDHVASPAGLEDKADHLDQVLGYPSSLTGQEHQASYLRVSGAQVDRYQAAAAGGDGGESMIFDAESVDLLDIEGGGGEGIDK